MKILKTIIREIIHVRSIKYVVVLAVGIAFIGFIGSNSVWAHFGYKSRINELQAEIDHYNSENRRDQEQIHQLQRDPKAMERIARERYYMKMADEDIFVLSDDNVPQTKPSADETVE